jgi:uncharacterized protein (TIGR03435 family)
VLPRVFAVLVVAATPAPSQDKGLNSQPQISFEVISVKPMLPDRQDRFESYCAGGGRFISRGTPLLWSIKWAYGVNDYQMSDGWPTWLNSFNTYEIEAETERPVTQDECRKMVQSLFEEKFKLRIHHESKVVPAYALLVGKHGPRFPATTGVTINGAVKQATSERDAPPGWTMSRLANYLATIHDVQRPVVDRTNLGGIYGFALSYSTAEHDDRPDIFAALRGQLGLDLKAINAPVEMWFIDRVEKPSGNE